MFDLEAYLRFKAFIISKTTVVSTTLSKAVAS